MSESDQRPANGNTGSESIGQIADERRDPKSGEVAWLRAQSEPHISRQVSGRVATPPPAPSGPRPAVPTIVAFNRHELREIMNLYGRMVAAGEWRDYAMDFSTDKAVFSIFRRTSEMPLYRIEKDPKLARKQGIYSVVAPAGLILRRGQDLARVISVIDRKIKLVAG